LRRKRRGERREERGRERYGIEEEQSTNSVYDFLFVFGQFRRLKNAKLLEEVIVKNCHEFILHAHHLEIPNFSPFEHLILRESDKV
jgi:hypothetical protein